MYVCRLCHAENKPTAKFCRRCGVARPPDVEVPEPVPTVPDMDSPLIAGKTPPQPDFNAVEAKAPDPVEQSPAAVVVPAEASEAAEEVPADVVDAPIEQAAGIDTGLGVNAELYQALHEEAEHLVVEEITEDELARELAEQRRAAAERRARELIEALVIAEARKEPAEAAGQASPAAGVETRRGGPTCVSCGTGIRAADKFCIWCGEKQPARNAPETKRCPECRTELPMKASYCFVCGSDVRMHHRARIRIPVELFQEDDPELFPRFEA